MTVRYAGRFLPDLHDDDDDGDDDDDEDDDDDDEEEEEEDDDCIWVRDLTSPMHLGLTNRPFVPHIKITGAL